MRLTMCIFEKSLPENTQMKTDAERKPAGDDENENQ